MQKVQTPGQADIISIQLQPLLTIPAVARILNVSRPTVYALIDSEGLPIIRLGRSVRVSPLSLEQWLAERESA